MDETATRAPLACSPGEIPLAEREGHRSLARRLFAEQAMERRALPAGREYRFAPGALPDVCRFVENERRCCPFLTFVVVVEPGGGGVRLRMTGPEGTGEFLDHELPERRTDHVQT